MSPTEGELIEYACHEGNYAMFNLLEVARDEDKANAAKPAGASPNETLRALVALWPWPVAPRRPLLLRIIRSPLSTTPSSPSP
jgi:hypothetical protein